MRTKADFIGCTEKYIKREGLGRLLMALEHSDFYTAPASTVYHDNCRGGLCHHSVRVFEELCKEHHILTRADKPEDISMESMAVVGLFHDICKVYYYEETTRNVKDEQTGQWHKEPFYKVNDRFPMGHGEKSLYLITDSMRLTPEEAMAVRWHMGGFEPRENYQYLSKAYAENKLALLLHLADMRATYLPEKEDDSDGGM